MIPFAPPSRARITVLAGALAACIGAAHAGSTEDGGARTFTFDGQFIDATGLTFEFSRPVETLDRTGAIVPANEPRWGPPRRIVPASTAEIIRDDSQPSKILASGLDHDGTTPLMVVLRPFDGILDVFTVAGDDLPDAEQTGVGRNRTNMNQGPSPGTDILAGAVPGKAYSPKAGAIAHGLIVLTCTVSIDTGETWTPASIAFVVSTDQGQTWSLHFEDEQDQLGQNRLREWSMQNWWPVEHDGPPLQAWFVSTDYRWKCCTGPPDGGRVVIFRATRSAPGMPWSLEPGATPIVVADGEGEHMHAAGIVPFGDQGGVRLLAAVGDGREYNRIISAIHTGGDYTDDNWQIMDDYHGSLGTGGFQFIGCAPGPQVGDLIVGADENSDQLVLLQPDDDPDSTAVPIMLYGQGFENGIASLNLVIRTPTPELGGPYVSTYFSGLDGIFGIPAMRVLFSPDGLEWTEAFTPGTGFLSACVHGDHIYLDGIADGPGLQRFPLPQTKRLRPLHVGPGGHNRMVSDVPLVDVGRGNEVTLLTPAERAALDPQPPCFGPVYDVQSAESATSMLGIWQMAGTNPDFPAGDVHVRMWCRATGTQNVRLKGIVGDGLGDETGPVPMANHIVQNPWFPVTLRNTFFPSDETDPYVFHFEGQARDPIDISSFQLAFDALTAGSDFPGYPLPLDVESPDELADVSGFTCGDDWTITLAGELPDSVWDGTTTGRSRWPLASLWADENNHVAILADAEDGRLAVRITADGFIVGTMELNGLFWVRGSQLRISIGQHADGIEMTASVGSGAPLSDSSPASLPVAPMRIRFGALEPAVGGGDPPGGGPVGTGDFEVSAFAWFGGRIDENTFLEQSQREQLLQQLDFLTTGETICPADLTGDDFVGPADLAILLGNWGVCETPGPVCDGDINKDGLVDPADLAAMLGLWGACPEVPMH